MIHFKTDIFYVWLLFRTLSSAPRVCELGRVLLVFVDQPLLTTVDLAGKATSRRLGASFCCCWSSDVNANSGLSSCEMGARELLELRNKHSTRYLIWRWIDDELMDHRGLQYICSCTPCSFLPSIVAQMRFQRQKVQMSNMGPGTAVCSLGQLAV